MKSGAALVRRFLGALAEGSRDAPGVTRDAYGPGEQMAHNLARAEALALGCEVRTDAAGNLMMTFAGADRDAPCLMVGSHLDSVPHGGNFDGAAGVAAGLALIADLVAAGVQPAQDLVVVAFRAEEAAWFPVSYPGSEAMLGTLDPALLEALHSRTGLTLAHHMRAAGFNPDAVRRGERQLDPVRIGSFVEVHIEQGPVLIGEGVPVGLVTAIAGGFRHTQARALGAWAHSGATPRGYRQDAVLAVADMAAGLDVAWDAIEAAGHSATITIGVVATDPALHGGSRVAGEVAFCIDIRSEFEEVLDGVRRELRDLTAGIAEHRGVTVDLGPEFTWEIAQMNAGLLTALEASAAAAGVATMRLPSGAGHDAAVLAGAGVPTAMLFVRNAHGSHNPDEAMEPGDLDQAVAVLMAYVMGSGGLA